MPPTPRTPGPGSKLSCPRPCLIKETARWLDPKLRKTVLDEVDGEGWPSAEEWCPGGRTPLPRKDLALIGGRRQASAPLHRVIEKAKSGRALAEGEIVRLFQARGDD